MAGKSKPRSRLSLDLFLKENSNHTSVCTMAVFLASLNPTDRAVIIEAMHDARVQGAAITRVLQSLGFTMGRQVISRHRREGCPRCKITPLKVA